MSTCDTSMPAVRAVQLLSALSSCCKRKSLHSDGEVGPARERGAARATQLEAQLEYIAAPGCPDARGFQAVVTGGSVQSIPRRRPLGLDDSAPRRVGRDDL